MPTSPLLYFALKTHEPLDEPEGLLKDSKVYVMPEAAASALRLANPAAHAAEPLLNHWGGVTMVGEKRSPVLTSA